MKKLFIMVVLLSVLFVIRFDNSDDNFVKHEKSQTPCGTRVLTISKSALILFYM